MGSGDWLGIVLGGGGVAFLAALGKGIQLWRDGTEARERSAIAGLEKWRRDADKRAERESVRADYYQALAGAWQQYAGTLIYELHSNGQQVPVQPPLPARPQEPSDDPPLPPT